MVVHTSDAERKERTWTVTRWLIAMLIVCIVNTQKNSLKRRYKMALAIEYAERDDYYDYDEEDMRVYFEIATAEVHGCCAARNLFSFPEDAEGMSDSELEELELDLKGEILDQRHYRCIIIFTNDYQEQTNKILRKLGFKHTRWMDKPDHEEDTRIRLWWWEPDRREEAYKWD
jgi:adenylate cyclase class IV